VKARFEERTTFVGLAAGAQKGYRHQRRLVEGYRTNLGVTLDQLAVARLGPAAIQRVVESITRGRDGDLPMPTKANHLLRYLRRMFAWGVQHGHCVANPASGVAQANERGKIKMPSPASCARLAAVARERGARDAHTPGSVAPYLPHLMVIAYSCRLRGIEVVTLREANATEEGILSNRRNSSRDNITRWSPALREAWEGLIQLRKRAEQRHRQPPQLHASKRPMLVSQRGMALSKSGLDSAWQRLISLAREGENPVLAEDEVFTLHGLKHRGITDSKDKASGGHRTERMRQRYDHETPLVEPTELPAFSGGFSGGSKEGA